MKFNIYRHNVSYYGTQLGEDYVEIIPIEDFTIIRVNNDTFMLPYGLLKYEQLLAMSEKEPKEFTQMLEDVVTGAGVSKYGYDTKEILDNLPHYETGDIAVMLQTLESMLENSDRLITKNEYMDMISSIIKVGKLVIPDDMLRLINKLGKSINPEIHNLAIPVLIELIKQLDQSGILQDIKDPAKMMKNYREGK